MKKITIIAGILIIVCLAAAPLVNGLVLERVVRRAHEQANEMYVETGSGINLEIVRYQRGYLTSEIEWRLLLGPLQSLYGVNEVILVDRAKHGLSGVVTETSLEKNPWFSSLIHQNPEVAEPISIKTRYGLAGGIQSTVTIASIEVATGDGRMQLGPGSIRITSDASLNKVVTEGHLDAITIGEAMRVEGVRLDSELEKVSTLVWQGGITCHLESMKAVEGSQSMMLRGLSARYGLDYDEEKGMLEITSELSAEEVSNDGVAVRKPRLRVVISSLEAKGYEEYMKVYGQVAADYIKSLENPRGGGMKDNPLDDLMAAGGMQLAAAAEQLLKKDLQISIDELSATLPEGDLSGSLTFRLNDDVDVMQVLALAQQPSLVPKVFFLHSQLSLPAGLVADPMTWTEPLHPAMPGGLFVRNGDKLVHEAITRDHTLYLNGKEVILD